MYTISSAAYIPFACGSCQPPRSRTTVEPRQPPLEIPLRRAQRDTHRATSLHDAQRAQCRLHGARGVARAVLPVLGEGDAGPDGGAAAPVRQRAPGPFGLGVAPGA